MLRNTNDFDKQIGKLDRNLEQSIFAVQYFPAI